MKYLLTTFILIALASNAAKAQDTLQQYTGKYKFPAGSVVAEIDVVYADGALTMNSAAGSSALRFEKGDQFVIVSYDGTAIFTRTNGKITGVHIEAMGYVMDGTRQEEGSIARMQGRQYKTVLYQVPAAYRHNAVR